jgi:hypothetical protein
VFVFFALSVALTILPLAVVLYSGRETVFFSASVSVTVPPVAVVLEFAGAVVFLALAVALAAFVAGSFVVGAVFPELRERRAV